MLPPSPDPQQGPQLPNDQGRAFGHSVTPARLFQKGVISEPLGNKMVFELRSRPGSTEPGLTSEADGRSSGAGREEGGDGRERMLRRVGGLLKKARRWPCCARILILPNSCNFVPLNQPRCPLRFPLPVGSHLGLTASEYGWWALGRTMGRPRPPSQDKPLARAPSLLSFHACTTLNARPPHYTVTAAGRDSLPILTTRVCLRATISIAPHACWLPAACFAYYSLGAVYFTSAAASPR